MPTARFCKDLKEKSAAAASKYVMIELMSAGKERNFGKALFGFFHFCEREIIKI